MIECLHLWLPDLPGSKGGIQMFSGHLLDAIRASGCVDRIRVIIRNNAGVVRPVDGPQIKFHTVGPYAARTGIGGFALLASRLAIQDRPNLILSGHANFSPLAEVLKYTFGTPYWVIAYGIEVWSLTAGRMRAALLNADRVLPISDFTRDRLLDQLTLAPGQIEKMPITFDSERFQIGPKPEYLLARHSLRQEQPIIFTVARLAEPERYKGYDRVLRAMPLVRQELPDVHYVIGGRGPDRGRIESLIQELDLTECVTLAGFIPDDELPDYYRMADVFAMPSKGEGFGIVYLEAMACGKPVLAGDQDGSTDALRQGELGALVDPDDISQIGNTLIQLLERTYSRPLLFQPQELRAAMLASFGPDLFRARVTALLNDFCESTRASELN